ncbi:2-hydroxyacid dehydrogenase [Spirobacillus cienkowskii]|uniref:2-hydroxyacid dehydrogenase n=1 Tax=Spirobacillus cienkowskii TaxID=495820 RepID=UPI0030CEC4A1
MKLLVFSSKNYEKHYFNTVNQKFKFDIKFLETKLTPETALLAKGFECICAFVNDSLSPETIQVLHQVGVKLIALRSAGFNHVHLATAKELGIPVVRVPAYSPHAIAEHTVALLLSLNRKIHKAYNRSREFNFSLEGLMGYDLYQKTIGIIGTGKIGQVMAKIMNGFGCRVLAYDKQPQPNLTYLNYCSLTELYQKSDIISLHVPLTKETHHLINRESIQKMKPTVTLINTSRGAIIDTKALIYALKNNLIKGACLDVYEEEDNYFFSDCSEEGIADDNLARLLTFPNVLITAHQAFLTDEAMSHIVSTTLENILEYKNGTTLTNAL